MRAPRRFSITLTSCSLLWAAHALPAGATPTPAGPAKASPAASAPALTAAAASTGTAGRAELPSAPSSAARAQSRAANGANNAIGPEEHARRLKVALAGLESSDPVEIQNALLNLKELQGRAAAEGIVARLRMGLPPQLGELALDVLGGLHQPIAVPLLSELTLHRRWQIRAKAITALGALHVRSAVSVLMYALDDPSAEVRSAAARALGMAGDPRATKALNAAMARGVDGAFEGLALLANNRQVDGLLAHAKSDLKAAEPALWLLISRPDLPVVSKVKVIQFVSNHDSTQEAEQVLALWREKLKASGDLRLMSALTPRPPQAGPKAQPVKLAGASGPAAPEVKP